MGDGPGVLVFSPGTVGTAVPGVVSGGGVLVVVGLVPVAVGLAAGSGVFVMNGSEGVGVISPDSNVAVGDGVIDGVISVVGVAVGVGVVVDVGVGTAVPSSSVGVGSVPSGGCVPTGAGVSPSGKGPKPGSGLGWIIRSTCKYQINVCGAPLPQPTDPSYNRQMPSTVRVVPEGTSFSTSSKPYPLS